MSACHRVLDLQLHNGCRITFEPFRSSPLAALRLTQHAVLNVEDARQLRDALDVFIARHGPPPVRHRWWKRSRQVGA